MSERSADLNMAAIPENELEAVSGGTTIHEKTDKSTPTMLCPKCGVPRKVTLVTGGRAICNACNTQIDSVAK